MQTGVSRTMVTGRAGRVPYFLADDGGKQVFIVCFKMEAVLGR